MMLYFTSIFRLSSFHLLEVMLHSFFPLILAFLTQFTFRQWRTEGGGFGGSTPLPEIPKALQNRAKLNPIVKTVKNC